MAIKVSKAKERSSTPHAHALVTDRQNPLSLAWPVEHWLQWQGELLKIAAPCLNGFLDRRGEALSAALRTAEKLAACRDLSDARSVQLAWVDGALERLDRDIEAAAEHAIALSHWVSDATQRAAETTRDAATLGMEQVLRVSEPVAAARAADAAIASAPLPGRDPAIEPTAAAKAAA